MESSDNNRSEVEEAIKILENIQLNLKNIDSDNNIFFNEMQRPCKLSLMNLYMQKFLAPESIKIHILELPNNIITKLINTSNNLPNQDYYNLHSQYYCIQGSDSEYFILTFYSSYIKLIKE